MFELGDWIHSPFWLRIYSLLHLQVPIDEFNCTQDSPESHEKISFNLQVFSETKNKIIITTKAFNCYQFVVCKSFLNIYHNYRVTN